MKKLLLILSIFIMTTTLALSAAAAVDVDSNIADSILLREQVRRVVAGESINLTALVKRAYSAKKVEFSSDATNIATVSSDGVVTGVTAGEATITATLEGKTSICKVIVLAEKIPAVKFADRAGGKAPSVKTAHLGDSITTYAPAIPSEPSYPRNIYHDWWGKLYYVDNQDCGISGTLVTKDNNNGLSFVNRFKDTLRDDAELITVKGGTNDNSSTPAGTVNDRTVDTYAGAIKIIMEGLVEKYPDKQIVFFSPIQRCEGDIRLLEYTNVLLQLGEIYGIPAIDIYTPEELDFRSKLIAPAQYNPYKDPVYESPLMPDGIHPSGMGHMELQAYMLDKMIASGVVEITWTNPFEDVAENAWYFENVKYVAQKKIMDAPKRVSRFEPDMLLTREMLVTSLYKNEGSPAVTGENPFADVSKGIRYEKAVIWAVENGIVNGISATEFAPNSSITREQIATIIYRYAKFKGIDVSQIADLGAYTDAPTVSDWAKEAMGYTVATKLIGGKTATTLNPKDSATRAEMATILVRFIEGNK